MRIDKKYTSWKKATSLNLQPGDVVQNQISEELAIFTGTGLLVFLSIGEAVPIGETLDSYRIVTDEVRVVWDK